jgi:hypothetical protein
MTGFLVAILGGGLSVAQSLAWLQHHFPVDWRWWRQWVEVGGGGWRWWWNVWRGDEGDAMTCRRRMPADGSRKKDYRAGPCKCPGSRFLWQAQAQRRRPLRVKAAPSATICTAYTACTCQTRPPPQLPCRYAPSTQF